MFVEEKQKTSQVIIRNGIIKIKLCMFYCILITDITAKQYYLL